MERFQQQEGDPPPMAVFGGLDLDPDTLGVKWTQVPFDGGTSTNFAWGLVDGQYPVGLEWGAKGEPEGVTLYADSADGAQAAEDALGELLWTPGTYEEAVSEGQQNPYAPGATDYGGESGTRVTQSPVETPQTSLRQPPSGPQDHPEGSDYTYPPNPYRG